MGEDAGEMRRGQCAQLRVKPHCRFQSKAFWRCGGIAHRRGAQTI